MEMKNNISEKMTDQSSNQSSISEKLNYGQQLANKINQKKNQDTEIIEDDNYINFMRKYTMEPQIFRKEFVPVLKPIVIHWVPTKLILNKNEFKQFGKNRNKGSPISCPCSEDENEINEELSFSNSSDISNLSNEYLNNNENGLKGIRKNFIKLKGGSIHKVMTRKTIKAKNSNKFDCFKNSDVEKEKVEKEDKDVSSNSDLYEDNIFNIYKMKPYDKLELGLKPNKSTKICNEKIKGYENEINEDKDKNNEALNKRNRINSMSILDTLKNRLKFEK
jgi:hypothetical protein